MWKFPVIAKTPLREALEVPLGYEAIQENKKEFQLVTGLLRQLAMTETLKPRTISVSVAVSRISDLICSSMHSTRVVGD